MVKKKIIVRALEEKQPSTSSSLSFSPMAMTTVVQDQLLSLKETFVPPNYAPQHVETLT
jgi:hypothetical protein